MTSAFSPVIQRAGSPRVTSVRLPPSRRTSTTFKRGRQTNSLLGQPLELVVENSREEGESPSPPPDHVSTSGSEGSDASNASQGPKILDFIGATTCEVTSWFTSCFPCAVMDIDEHDGRVAGKLSQESAMNFMYNSPKTKVGAPDDEPLHEEAALQDVDYQHARIPPYVRSPQIGAVDSNVMYTHIPIMTVADSDHIRSKGSAHKLRVIEDDDATEVETVSLDSERQGPVSPIHSHGRKRHVIVPKKMKKLFGGSSSSKKKKNAAVRN